MLGTAWIWIAIAAPLLVAGAVFIVRFVVGDRSRGRPRCPRCWYDMGGGQEKCPECGRVVRSERDLRRARRPKRWAVVGVGFLVLGGASLVTRQAVVHGAVSLVPDWVLVAGMERWEPGGHVGRELSDRLEEGRISLGAQRRLIRRAFAEVSSADDPRRVRAAVGWIQSAEWLGRDEEENPLRPWGHWVRASEVIPARELAVSLARASARLSNSDHVVVALTICGLPEGRAAAIPVIAAAAADGASADACAMKLEIVCGQSPVPYRGLARSLPEAVRGDPMYAELRSFAVSLAPIEEDAGRFRARLVEGLSSPSEDVRLLSMWIIRDSLWPDDELRLLALSRYDADSEFTALATIDFAVSGPLDEPAMAVLRRALRSEHWRWTADLVGERGDEAASLGVDLREMLTTWRARDCVVSYASVTGDRAGAARVLLAIAEEKPRRWSPVLLEDFGRIGWSDERVVAFLSDHLTASEPLDRLHAATALLRLGAPKGSDKAELTRILAEAVIAKYRSLSMITAFTDVVQFGESDIPTVLDILGDCSTRGSGSVVRALGMAGTAAEQALPWLHEHADNQSSVSWEAEYAIRRIEWCLEHGDPPPAPRDQW